MTHQEFSTRVDGIKARLYKTAYLYTGDEATALDLVDETIYRGLKSIKKLREPDFFETWLTRILINLCHDELRCRRRETIVEELPETAVESYDALPLKEALLRLPRELKSVIILRFFSDYTLAETAATLDIPQGTVVTRQRKALKLLRLELLEEE